MTNLGNTYKYYFKIRNLRVHCGITNDLAKEEYSHKKSGRYTIHNGKKIYWCQGHIVQVGEPVSVESAIEWEKENIYNLNLSES